MCEPENKATYLLLKAMAQAPAQLPVACSTYRTASDGKLGTRLKLWHNGYRESLFPPLLQHAVFYKDEECLGGASILKAGPLPWEQG